MKSCKSLIHPIERSFYLFALVIYIVGCVTTTHEVTTTPETVKTMSDQFLCELLGPNWISTSDEQKVIRDELGRRGVVCDFGQIVGYRKEPTKEPSEEHRASTGTGFAISSIGILVTAYHVVEGATNIEVKFAGERWMPAMLVRYSRSTDVAILQIENTLSTCLSLKSANTLRVGDFVFTMGFPVVELLGTEAKYTDGKISSLSGVEREDSLMQITVPIQPGNSGGPLVTSDGYVVGLITSTTAVKYFYAITETLPQNINWAVKSDYILPLLREGDLECSETKIANPVQIVSKAICLVKAE